MDILNLIVGLFMIGIGSLVKSAPNLIAGYNTMPKEKKENVDIEGLSTFMRNGLIGIGLSIIIGYYLFEWLGFTMTANSITLIVPLVGITILVIYVQKFDHNKTKKAKQTSFIFRFVFIIHVFALLFAIGLITYGFTPSKTIYGNDTIRFTGMYGFEVSIDEIANVELSDTLPSIKIRTNGFSFGAIKKGFFNLDKFGKSRLLIHSESAPYLILSKTNKDRIIMSFKDKNETKKLHDEIKGLIER